MKLFDSINRLNELYSLHSEYSGSTEAINFQVNSQFPIELTKVFDEFLAYADHLDSERTDHGTAEGASNKHLKMKLRFEKEIGPRIGVIIEKYTKFKVKEVTTTIPTTFDNVLGVYMKINQTEVFDQIITLVSIADASHDGNVVKSNTPLHDMLDISRSLDKARGQILRGVALSVDINIPIGVFVVKDFLSDNADRCQLTGVEITAAILHETGHVFSFVEYLADLSYLGYYGNNILRDVTTRFESDPKKVISELESIAAKQKPSKLIRNTLILLKRITGATVAETDDGAAADRQYNGEFFKIIEGVLIHILMYVIMVMVFPLTMVSMIALMMIPSSGVLLMTKGNMNSRELVTPKNSSMFERLADEYVSRYKMSKELNSALIKIGLTYDEIIKLGYNIPIYSKALRDSMLLQLFVGIMTIPSTLFSYVMFIKNDDVAGEYEDVKTRLRRNISNLVDALKDKSIDPAFRDSILRDIESMDASLKTYNDQHQLNAIERIFKIILNIPSNIITRPLITIFGSANLDREYMALFEELDDMLSNRGFYYSAQIASILKK